MEADAPIVFPDSLHQRVWPWASGFHELLCSPFPSCRPPRKLPERPAEDTEPTACPATARVSLGGSGYPPCLQALLSPGGSLSTS